MSNYNTQLQNNNINLQDLLIMLQNLPDKESSSVLPDFTHEVIPIAGASYGFKQNDNGYWESQNKGVNNSMALCQVNFKVFKECDFVAFKCTKQRQNAV